MSFIKKIWDCSSDRPLADRTWPAVWEVGNSWPNDVSHIDILLLNVRIEIVVRVKLTFLRESMIKDPTNPLYTPTLVIITCLISLLF